MVLHEIINAHYSEFSATEKGICDFVLENIDEVIKMNIKDFSKLSLSSKSSVIRFSQKLGFTGFTEFRNFLKWEVTSKSKTDTNYSFFDQVLNDSHETIKHIKNQNWDTLYKKVHEAEQVYIIATGITQQVQASEFQRLFMLTGKNVRVIPGNKDVSEFQRMSELMTKNDLIFILSLSGENKDLENVINILKVKKIKMVSMTNYLNNWLSINCDYNLYCYSSKNPAPTTWWLRTTSTFFILIETFIFGYNDFIKKI